MKLLRKNRGFTLVEVVVVVVGIAILAGIVIASSSMYAKTSRDSSRQAKASIVASSLEKYYTKNNEYPSVALMTSPDAGLIKQKLDIADESILIFPLANKSVVNSIVTENPSTRTVTYTGSVESVDSQDQCLNSINGFCDAFELKYIKESDNSTVIIKSQRSNAGYIQPVAAPSKPITYGTYISSATVRLTSEAPPCGSNTLQYKIRYNTASINPSAMPDWNTITWSSSDSRIINPGSSILFYIQSMTRCIGSQSQASSPSEPSDIATFTKPTPPAAPSVVASAIPTVSTSIVLSWDSVPKATSYTVTGPGSATNCTTSPCTVTGLSPSTTYTFSVRAVNAIGQSPAGSASVTTTAAPAVPAKISSIWVSSTTSTTTTWSWPRVSCNIGTPRYYVVLYTHGYDTWSPAVVIAQESITLDTTTQGTNYELIAHVACVNGGEWSHYSPQTNAPLWFRALDAPGIWATATGPSTANLYWSLPPGADGVWIGGGGNANSCQSSPCSITGLTPGATNSFTVVATNTVTDEYSFATYSISNPHVTATTPAKVSSIWPIWEDSSNTWWEWNHVACNTGYPRYHVQMYTHGPGTITDPVYTTENTIYLNTSSQGLYYELLVLAQCVGGGNSSGWSAQTSSPLRLRAITASPLVNGGNTTLTHDSTNAAPNSIWGQGWASSTTTNGCPAFTTLQYSYAVYVDDYPYVGPVAWGPNNTYVIYKSALWLQAKFEVHWYTICTGNYGYTNGSQSMSDNFGNGHPTQLRNRAQGIPGRWAKGCQGHSHEQYAYLCNTNEGGNFPL